MTGELRVLLGTVFIVAVLGCGKQQPPNVAKVDQPLQQSEPVKASAAGQSDDVQTPDSPQYDAPPTGQAAASTETQRQAVNVEHTDANPNVAVDADPPVDDQQPPANKPDDHSPGQVAETEILPPAFRLMLPTTAGMLLVDIEIRVGGQLLADAFDERIDQVIADVAGDQESELTWEDLFIHVAGDTEQFGRAMGMNRGQYRQMIQLYDSNRNNRPDHGEVAKFLFRNSGIAVPFRLSGTDYYREINRTESVIFKVLDVNEDRRLDAAELEQASAAIFRFDPNADQRIDVSEVIVSPATAPNRPNDDPAWFRRRSNRRGEVAMDLAGYVDWSMLSYSLDGYRGSRPFGLPENPIDGIDADSDNSISTHEAKSLTDSAADLRLLINLDDEATIDVVQLRPESVQVADVAKNQLAISDDSFCLLAQVTDRQNQRDRIPAEAFRTLDANNDGGLDEDEIPDGAESEFSFEDLDADEDGRLTLAEINSAGRNQKQPIWAVQVRARGAEFPDAVFGWLDANHDQFLSTREMLSAGERLKQCSVDGQPIKATDIPDTFALQFLRGDSTQDQQNFVFAQPAPAEKTAWPVWAENMDTNRDGEISQLEFPGSLHQFTKLDANGDNFLSADEVKLE